MARYGKIIYLNGLISYFSNANTKAQGGIQRFSSLPPAVLTTAMWGREWVTCQQSPGKLHGQGGVWSWIFQSKSNSQTSIPPWLSHFTILAYEAASKHSLLAHHSLLHTSSSAPSLLFSFNPGYGRICTRRKWPKTHTSGHSMEKCRGWLLWLASWMGGPWK